MRHCEEHPERNEVESKDATKQSHYSAQEIASPLRVSQ